MRVISRRALREYYEGPHPETKKALEAWYHEVRHAHWRSPADVRKHYPKAHIIGKNRVVFKIRGDEFRLVVGVNYDAELVFVRFLGTHAEYDRIDVASI